MLSNRLGTSPKRTLFSLHTQPTGIGRAFKSAVTNEDAYKKSTDGESQHCGTGKLNATDANEVAIGSHRSTIEDHNQDGNECCSC